MKKIFIIILLITHAIFGYSQTIDPIFDNGLGVDPPDYLDEDYFDVLTILTPNDREVTTYKLKSGEDMSSTLKQTIP